VFNIRTSDAFIVSTVALIAGFVFSAFRTAPYAEFAAAIVASFSAYAYKRISQRQAKYQPNGNGNGEGECEGKEIPSDRPAIVMKMEKPQGGHE